MSKKLYIGKLIVDTQNRDAIHMAVAPVIAGEPLSPGQHIGFTERGIVGKSKTPIGIVDPFLNQKVLLGEKFWMFLYPETITSLRHEWSHPEFDKQSIEYSNKSSAILQITGIAQDLGLSYDTLMEGADDWIKYNASLNCGPLLDGASLPHEFWDLYEEIRSVELTSDKKYSFFSCSC